MVKTTEVILRSRVVELTQEQHKGVVKCVFGSKLKSLIELARSSACKSVAHNLRY